MVEEAERNKETDAKRREGIEAKNEGEALCYDTEKQLEEYKSQLGEDAISEINQQLQKVKDLLPQGDATEIKKEVNILRNLVMKKFEKVVRGGQQTGPEEAEVVDEDENEKKSKF